MANVHAKKLSLKQRLMEEIRRLVAIATYLTVFFLVFRLYTSLILEELHVDYFAYGLTVVKALVLAKIILAGDVLKIGARFDHQPLIIPTLYNTVVFAAFALVSEIAEHLILGAVLHGLGPSAVFAEILDKGWPNLAGMTLVVFVSFIPFFAFREIEQVLGEGTLFELFFTRKRTVIATNPESRP